MKEYAKHLIFTAAILVSILPSLVAQSGTYHTVRDLEVWTAAKIEYKLNKKLDFGFEEQIRLKDDASNIDQYFSEITAGYKLNKKISLGLGLRYIKKNDNEGKIQGYENHLRWNGDLSYKHKVERFGLKYRLRYQSKNELNVSEAQGDTLKKTIRLKVGSTYNIKDWKLDPKVSAEIFNVLNNNEGFSKVRFTIGTEYKTKNWGDVGAFYRMEKELKENYPKTTNIIGIQYQYTIKRKPNEK